MKKIVLFFVFIIFSLSLYGIKFYVDKKDDNKLQIQVLFSGGVSQSATKDLFGLTEYQAFFFKLGFHIEEFGFLYNFDAKFRLFAEKPTFYEGEWFVPNSGLQTFLLYLDKFEYIKYGSESMPIKFNTGTIPYLTFGAGLLVSDFHNRFFLPVAKENGFYFKFDGTKLNKFKTINLPIDFTFFITDLFDPDIMGVNTSIDIFEFTKIRKDFGLSASYSAIVDLDVNEKNRLSTIDETLDSGNYRNMISNGYSSCLFLQSFFSNFVYKNRYFRINIFNESGFLFDLYNKVYDENVSYKQRFGFGNKFGGEIRFVEIKDSDFLLGVTLSLIATTENFIFDYFSSNYEIVRNKKYLNLPKKGMVAINGGFAIYFMNDNLKFYLGTTIPLGSEKFIAKFLFKFTLEKLDIKGQTNLPDLYINVTFENGLNEIKVSDELGYGGANGGYFLTTFTDDFRFFCEIGFKMYSAKIGMIIGLQRPQSVTPYISPDDPNKEINLDKYSNDLQKFVRLEVAFVL